MSEENTVTGADNSVGLSVNDLIALRQIIAVAAQRGAFKAEEMEVVGGHYNRLNAFVQNIAPQTETTEDNTSSEE
jgi:hypothetical protein